jgi:hypothetical protein
MMMMMMMMMSRRVIQIPVLSCQLERPRFTTYRGIKIFITRVEGSREIFIRDQIIIGGILYLFLGTKYFVG